MAEEQSCGLLGLVLPRKPLRKGQRPREARRTRPLQLSSAPLCEDENEEYSTVSRILSPYVDCFTFTSSGNRTNIG
jgi:hypothetical protein